MQIVDLGVLPPSFMDFSLTTDFAQRVLYYAPKFGHFFCDGRYKVERDFLDQFLLIYVKGGELCLEDAEGETVAHADEILLLDCRRPHKYFCRQRVDFLWFHFAGAGSADYVDYLTAHSGKLYAGDYVRELLPDFERLTGSAEKNEHLMSAAIHRVLATLAAPGTRQTADSRFAPALVLVHNHYAEEISLGDLARASRMSVSHFLHSFKKALGFTPHEYLLLYRLRQAKRLLLSSEYTGEEIAEKCGFNSASHFARAFRAKEGMSPKEFRHMHF